MTLVAYLTALVKVQDPNVVGVAVLKPETVAQTHWHVVERVEGRVRIDTADGQSPTQAAIDVALSADISPAAIAAYVDSATPDKITLRGKAAEMISEIDNYLAIADTATQAQVRAAVKGLAVDVKRILKYLASTL